MNLIIYLFQNTLDEYLDIQIPMGGGKNILSLVYIVIVAPVAEEILFRGLILKKLLHFMNFKKANLIQSLLFGLMHLNFLQFVFAAICGYTQAKIFDKYKTIYAPILLHILINLFGILIP